MDLLVKPYLGGTLFGKNSRDIRLNVWKAGTCLFAGYIEPQVFNQPYSKKWDQLTITAYDGLGSLQYYFYGDIQTNDEYIERKSRIDSVLIKDILIDSFKNIRQLDIKNGTQSGIFYDGSVKVSSQSDADSIFSKVQLYESLFFGETLDDLWEGDKTVEEILKYFNLHIRQDGLHYYIYHIASIGQNVTWTSILDTPFSHASIQGTDTYILVMDDYLPDGEHAREKLMNVADTTVFIPGNRLEEVLDDAVLQLADGTYVKYYLFVMPDGSKRRSNKYIVIDATDDLIFLHKPGDLKPYKVLAQSPDGDYNYNSLDDAPSQAYSGGTFAKSSYKAKENDYIVAER